MKLFLSTPVLFSGLLSIASFSQLSDHNLKYLIRPLGDCAKLPGGFNKD